MPANSTSAGESSSQGDRKSTRLNSSHTEIYTLSLHDALPIFGILQPVGGEAVVEAKRERIDHAGQQHERRREQQPGRSEEHTSELQSHRDLHSFPTRRSSDLWDTAASRR